MGCLRAFEAVGKNGAIHNGCSAQDPARSYFKHRQDQRRFDGSEKLKVAHLPFQNSNFSSQVFYLHHSTNAQLRAAVNGGPR